jgi:hypothetical protein
MLLRLAAKANRLDENFSNMAYKTWDKIMEQYCRDGRTGLSQ